MLTINYPLNRAKILAVKILVLSFTSAAAVAYFGC